MASVAIIAPEQDPHAIAVRDRLRAGGTDARILDALRFPGELRISMGDRLDDISIDGERLRPTSVYARDLGLNPLVTEADLEAERRGSWRRAMTALRERSEVVLSLVHRWEEAGIPIYNPLSTRHRITKPYQIGLLAAAGLPVPESCWTNDPDEVRRFAAGRRIAYKPVAGGAATQELRERDLSPERLALLSSAPVCFQELLPGRDIRVYVVDGAVVCGIRIVTDALDFRQHEQALEAFEVDDELRSICVRATALLGLRFTGMDLKADAHGRLKILELNPSPMFLGFDARAGTDILGALCAALASPPR
jgi:glutathione synthase/RimK-type ligase-like ATP-grasp enzyme